MHKEAKKIIIEDNDSILKIFKDRSLPVITLDKYYINVNSKRKTKAFKKREKISTESLETIFITEVVVGKGKSSVTMYGLVARYPEFIFAPIAIVPKLEQAQYLKDEIFAFYSLTDNEKVSGILNKSIFEKRPPENIFIDQTIENVEINIKERHRNSVIFMLIGLFFGGLVIFDIIKSLEIIFVLLFILFISFLVFLIGLLLFRMNNIIMIDKDHFETSIKFMGKYDSKYLKESPLKFLSNYENLGFNKMPLSTIKSADIYYYGRPKDFRRFLSFEHTFYHYIILKKVSGEKVIISYPFKNRTDAIYVYQKICVGIAKFQDN